LAGVATGVFCRTATGRDIVADGTGVPTACFRALVAGIVCTLPGTRLERADNPDVRRPDD